MWLFSSHVHTLDWIVHESKQQDMRPHDRRGKNLITNRNNKTTKKGINIWFPWNEATAKKTGKVHKSSLYYTTLHSTCQPWRWKKSSSQYWCQSRGRSRPRRTAVGAGEAAAHSADADADSDSNAGTELGMRMHSVNGAAVQRCQIFWQGGGGKGDRYCNHLAQTIIVIAMAVGGDADSGTTTALIADT